MNLVLMSNCFNGPNSCDADDLVQRSASDFQLFEDKICCFQLHGLLCVRSVKILCSNLAGFSILYRDLI
eukprot:c34926_g1_i1 orf=200-406(+)